MYSNVDDRLRWKGGRTEDGACGSPSPNIWYVIIISVAMPMPMAFAIYMDIVIA